MQHITCLSSRNKGIIMHPNVRIYQLRVEAVVMVETVLDEVVGSFRVVVDVVVLTICSHIS